MCNNDFIEVADISTENEYIKIYTYEKYALENYDEIIPFCTYYFNVLSLCLFTNDVEKLYAVNGKLKVTIFKTFGKNRLSLYQKLFSKVCYIMREKIFSLN